MNLHFLYFLAGAGVMATVMVCCQFLVIKALNNFTGQIAVVRAKRKRQREMMPFHPRRKEALTAWSNVQAILIDSSRHSRFANFRSETGKPVAVPGAGVYSCSIAGAITLAIWPEPVPDAEDSSMDRVWRGELQDLLAGLVWSLIPDNYEGVDDFSNFAPWPEIQKVLRQGQEILSK